MRKAVTTATLHDEVEPAGAPDPVWWQPRGIPLALPVEMCGTLVLQNIAALDGHDQARLRVWCDDPARRTQVVSTTAYPLFPLVDCGAFDATLYYRLSVLRFSLSAA